MIDLILDDCMNIMKDYKDNHFDLAIVDPPYGIGNDGGFIGGAGKNFIGKLVEPKNYTKKEWDSKPPEKEYFNELIRVSKNQIIWGANHFISKIPYDSSCWIVWDKNNAGKFADCELAYTSFDTAVRLFRYKWAGFLQEHWRKEERIHPTQKPVDLYSWLLDKYSEKGQKILDTHLGSGSIAVSCYYFGVDLVCIEIDEEYYNKAKERVDNLTKQETLF